MDRLQVSGNVQAEIAERISDVASNTEAPDFTHDEDFEGVVSKELHEPLAALFITQTRIRNLQRSEAWGDQGKQRQAVEWLMRDLADVKSVLVRLWDEA